jgi:hypothetical protein
MAKVPINNPKLGANAPKRRAQSLTKSPILIRNAEWLRIAEDYEQLARRAGAQRAGPPGGFGGLKIGQRRQSRFESLAFRGQPGR